MTTDYQKEQITRGETLRDTASAIITALGPDWTPEVMTDRDNAQIIVGVRGLRADGMRLNFYRVWNKARFEISPIIPGRRDSYSSALRDWGVAPYNMPEPSCTVALDRDPVQAARQIVRAVITPYAPMYAAIIEQRAKDAAHDTELAGGLATLTKGLEPFGKVRVTDNSAKGTRSEFTVIAPGADYRTVIAGTVSDGTTDIKISGVSIALAIKIAAMVEDARAKA